MKLSYVMNSMLAGLCCAGFWYICRTGGMTSSTASYEAVLHQSFVVFFIAWFVIWFIRTIVSFIATRRNKTKRS